MAVMAPPIEENVKNYRVSLQGSKANGGGPKVMPSKPP